LERAAKEEAVVYWGDETGMSNCEMVERGFAPKGYPPVLPVETKRERSQYTLGNQQPGQAKICSAI